LVGRAREVAELEAELKLAAAGEVRSVLLVADPGVGKSRLAAEIVARNRRSVTGLTAWAYPLGATASFGLWAEALERQLSSLGAEDIRRLCGGVLDDLAVLLRSVAAVHGSVPAHQPPRLRLLEALTTVVRNLSRDSPVLVVLDDAHLADASSWDALSYLIRNLTGSRLLVIAVARPAELAANQIASETVLGLEQDGLMRRFTLWPLGRDELAKLAEEVLDISVASDRLVEWLFDRSRGNPLFALGLLRSLIDEGSDLDHPQLRRLPEEMTARVLARMQRLDEPALAILELLAALGQRIELDELVQVSGRPQDELGDVLDALLRQRLVVEEERSRSLTYEIAHPLIQETIYQSIAGARKRSIHRGIARALLAAGRVEAAAPHFVQSAAVGDAEAISTVLDAFRQAEERESHREAMALLEALLALIPAGDRRWLDVLDVMSIDAEWVIDHTGDFQADTGIEALRQIEPLLEGSSDLARRGLVKLRLISFLTFGTGEFAAAEQAGLEALDLFQQSGQTVQALLAANELSWVKGLAGDPAAEAAAARDVLAAAEEARHPGLTMYALGSLAWAAFHRGRFAESEAALRRSAAIARAEGKLYRLTWSLTALAFSLAVEGRLAEADALLREARVGNPAYPDAVYFEVATWWNWLAGRFPAAAESRRQSVMWTKGAASSRRGWGIPPAVVAMVGLGEVRQARVELADATGRGQHQVAVGCCIWAHGCLAEARGDVPTAVADLHRAVDVQRSHGFLPFAAIACADLAEAAMHANRPGSVDEAVDHLEAMLPSLDAAFYRGVTEFARAVRLLTYRENDVAFQHARRAANLFGGAGAAAFHARALEAEGRALVPLDRDAAVTALSDAANLFDACGARFQRDRALKVLGGIGQAGKRALVSRVGSDALSPRERDVVRLAADGHTAREIGNRLHIGERTVETHLASAYAKLGVESKVDLIRRFAELPI
jgi:DNA-binding CsgD family transcriptional regulator